MKKILMMFAVAVTTQAMDLNRCVCAKEAILVCGIYNVNTGQCSSKPYYKDFFMLKLDGATLNEFKTREECAKARETYGECTGN